MAAGADKMEEEVPGFNQFDEDDDEFVGNAWKRLVKALLRGRSNPWKNGRMVSILQDGSRCQIKRRKKYLKVATKC